MDQRLLARLEREIAEEDKKKPATAKPRAPPKKKAPISAKVQNMYEIMPKELLMESPNPNLHLHGMKLPFRLCCVSPSGSGKTNWLCNLLALFSSGPGTFHHITVVTRNKDEPLYKWLESLNDRIKVLEGLENAPLLDKMDKDLNNLVVFDDLVLTKDQTRIANYYIRARKLNCSVCYLSQSYFAIPKIIRQNCTFLVLLKLSGARELNLILSEGGLGIDKNELLRIYKEATAEKFSPLIIDYEAEAGKRYRKGFDEFIPVSESQEA